MQYMALMMREQEAMPYSGEVQEFELSRLLPAPDQGILEARRNV